MNLLMKTMSIMEERMSLTESRMSQMMALQRTMQQQQQQQQDQPQQSQKIDLQAYPSTHHNDNNISNTSNIHANYNNYSNGTNNNVSRNIINTTRADGTTTTNATTSLYHSSTSSIRSRIDLSPSSTDDFLQPVSTPDLRLVQLRVMCRQRGLDPNGSELDLLKRLNEAATTTSSTIASTTAGSGRVISTTTSAGANTGSMQEVHMNGHGIYEEDHHHHHDQQQPHYQHIDDTIEYDLGEDDYDAIAAVDDSHDPLRIIDGEDDDSSDDGNVHIIEENTLELNDEEMFGVVDDYDVEKYGDDDGVDEGDDDKYDI